MKARLSVSILIIGFTLHLFASGTNTHISVGNEMFPKLYNYVIQKGIIAQEDVTPLFYLELEELFLMGSIAPDVWRDDSEEFFIKLKDDVEKGIFYSTYQYMKENVVFNIDGFNKQTDIHEHTAYIIYNYFNNEYLLNNPSMLDNSISKSLYYYRLFFLLGLVSHNIEDLYVDMFWDSYLSEIYGFGDFTKMNILYDFNSPYNDYSIFKDVETYLDAVAGLPVQKMNSIVRRQPIPDIC